MSKNPLCEVFGFPITNTGKRARRFGEALERISTPTPGKLDDFIMPL
jgi:hypothetical protein